MLEPAPTTQEATPAALLRQYLGSLPQPTPAPAFQYHAKPCQVGTVADLPMRPGPQAFNGGITPGYRPRRRGNNDFARMGHLRALARRLREQDEDLDALAAVVAALAAKGREKGQ